MVLYSSLLDVWNRGIEKFGLKELRAKFIDFKEYYFGEVPIEFKQLYYTNLPKIEKLNINANVEGVVEASSTKNIHAREPSRESMGTTILKWLGFSPKNQ